MAMSSFIKTRFVSSPLDSFLSFVKHLDFAGGFSTGFSLARLGIWSINEVDKTLVDSLIVVRGLVVVSQPLFLTRHRVSDDGVSFEFCPLL